MKKKDILGQWFDPRALKPSDIEDYQYGQYIILRMKFLHTTEWQFRIGYYMEDFFNKTERFFIPMDRKIPFRIEAWTILPEFDSNKITKELHD